MSPTFTEYSHNISISTKWHSDDASRAAKLLITVYVHDKFHLMNASGGTFPSLFSSVKMCKACWKSHFISSRHLQPQKMEKVTSVPTTIYRNVLGVLFTMGLYCTPKVNAPVKHSRQLFEHTYMSNLYGTGTLTPIEFFQQYLLWQSSNTHSHSYSHKASKHMSGQSMVGLSVHLHTTTAPQRIVHH
jgi:hypothetical protein